MEGIIDHVVLSSWDDEARFRAILDPAIKAGELPKYPAYAKKLSKKQKAKQQQEAKEAEKAARKLGLRGDNSEDKLKQLITQNNARSESRFTSLISKYVLSLSLSLKGCPSFVVLSRPSVSRPSTEEARLHRAKAKGRARRLRRRSPLKKPSLLPVSDSMRKPRRGKAVAPKQPRVERSRRLKRRKNRTTRKRRINRTATTTSPRRKSSSRQDGDSRGGARPLHHQKKSQQVAGAVAEGRLEVLRPRSEGKRLHRVSLSIIWATRGYPCTSQETVDE